MIWVSTILMTIYAIFLGLFQVVKILFSSFYEMSAILSGVGAYKLYFFPLLFEVNVYYGNVLFDMYIIRMLSIIIV